MPTQIVSPVIVVADANLLYPVDIGSQGLLTRLQIVGVDGKDSTAVTVDVYSRTFTWTAALAITTSATEGSVDLTVHSTSPLPLAVDDLITLTGSVYNTTSRVTRIIDAYTVVVAADYSADDSGTLQLSVPTTEKELYRLASRLTITPGTSLIFSDTAGLSVVNLEPLPRGTNTRKDYPLYLKFSATGSYRVAATLIKSI